MKRTPIITLLAGLGVAAVLLVMSSIAANRPAAVQEAPPAPVPSSPSEQSPSESPAAPASAAPKVNATWAGAVDGGGVSIAIAVHDGVAVAYLCDGKELEAWLQGTAVDGKLTLTGKNGAALTGTFGNGKATGTVNAAGRTWNFTASAEQAKSGGLYRISQLVNNVRVVCGWIVFLDGRQVGICTPEGGPPETAPRLDTSANQPLDPQDLS